MENFDAERPELVDKVVYINRVAKVVKGGRRFSFSALVVVGDKNGHVGVALGKANEVPDAIRKGIEKAKKSMMPVSRKGTTIPHLVIAKFGASKVLMKPASEGTGIIAGNVVRALVDAAGISDILTKCIGSTNPHNVVKATMLGFKSLRSSDQIAEMRGVQTSEKPSS